MADQFEDEADLAVDVRRFFDPYDDKSIRKHCGRHWKIQRGVQENLEWPGWLQELHHKLSKIRNGKDDEGASLIVDVTCNRGRHRSVAVATILGFLLQQQAALEVTVVHKNNQLCQCNQCVEPRPLLTDVTYRVWNSLGSLGRPSSGSLPSVQ